MTTPVMNTRELAAYFAEVSHDLMSANEEPVTFDRVVRRAVDVIPGCDHAGITVSRRRGRPTTIAATDPLVRQCDELRYQVDEGPWLDGAFQHENCISHDLAREPRWTTWGPAAAALGARSLLAVRLHTADETLGALNLYGSQVYAFEGETLDIALIFAAHATEALAKAKLVTGLQAALETRHVIGMAQGLLAQRYDISLETAFEVLRRHSNHTNVKLREVAAMVLVQRSLPALESRAAQA